VTTEPAPPTATRERAERMRELILEMAIRARSAHIGSSLSIADILAVLYFDVMRRDRPRPDRFLLSKGHAASALYAALALAGDLDESEVISGYCADGGRLAGHPERSVPGVEITAGSLGHGPAVAVGLALADRIDGSDRRTFCLVGDGELDEGSVWEAAALAAQLGLGSMTLIVDANGLQGLGSVGGIVNLEPLAERFASFGWWVADVPGHDHDALAAALSVHDRRPGCVIARTVKGYGVDFMENDFRWHYRSLRETDRERVLTALRRTRRLA
jgi:transketolase